MARPVGIDPERAVAVTLACAETPAEPGDPLAPASLAEGRGAETRGGILELREQLGLTDAQVAEIQQIMKDLEAANAPLRAQLRPADGQPPGGDAAHAVMEQIRDHVRAAQEQIRGVLTDAQEAKLCELRPEQPGLGRGGPGFGGPMLDLLRLRERLELTDDQVSVCARCGSSSSRRIVRCWSSSGNRGSAPAARTRRAIR